MKCLTICEPWAWAVIHGPKRIENRPWFTNYRGPLLIHSGKSRQWLRQFRAEQPYLQAPENLECGGAGCPADDSFSFGCVIGRVNLVNCLPVDHHLVAGQPFAYGPWCWIFEDPQPLATPVPIKGQMGLYEVDESILISPAPPEPTQNPTLKPCLSSPENAMSLWSSATPPTRSQ